MALFLNEIEVSQHELPSGFCPFLCFRCGEEGPPKQALFSVDRG